MNIHLEDELSSMTVHDKEPFRNTVTVSSSLIHSAFLS